MEYPCLVRVTDLATKKTLAAGEAGTGQFVSVDAKAGISIGDVKAKPGPLDPDGRYGIFLEPK